MLSLKLFNLVLNLALLGLLIAVLVKKDKKEKFNGDELAAPAPSLFAPSLNSDIKNIATVGSIKTLKSDLTGQLSGLNLNVPAGTKPPGPFVLKDIGTNAEYNTELQGFINAKQKTISPDVVNLGKWKLGSPVDDLLSFGYDDGTTQHNPVFFRYDPSVPGTGHVWAQQINSPGYAKTSEWKNVLWDQKPPLPTFPPPPPPG